MTSATKTAVQAARTSAAYAFSMDARYDDVENRIARDFPQLDYAARKAVVKAGSKADEERRRELAADARLDAALAEDAAAQGVDLSKTPPMPDADAAAAANDDSAEADAKTEQLSDRETAVRLATAADLWRSDGTAYATIPVRGHFESFAVASPSFTRWLTLAFADVRGKAPSTDAIATARQFADATAHQGPEYPVHLRVAHHEGAVYVDLCDDEWSVVKITADGWRMVKTAPVKFRRSPGSKALPVPQHGGSLDLLRPYLNAQDDEQWILMRAWLAGTLSAGPFQILALSGAAGVAKTSTARVLRQVVDPSTLPTRRKPKDADDLTTAAKGSAVLVFDNLSSINAELSDNLCMLATGGGVGKRALYTDDTEHAFFGKRAMILTSVEEVVSRGDLNSRTSSLALPPLAERQDELALTEGFERDHPKILGALFDAASESLRRLDGVQIPNGEDIRMADWARWVLAASGALGFSEAEFLDAFTRNREDAHAVEVETSPFCNAVHLWLRTEKPNGWEGTPAKFLELVTHWAAAQDMPMGDAWPKLPQNATSRLNSHAAALAGVGVGFSRPPRTKDGRPVRLTYSPPSGG